MILALIVPHRKVIKRPRTDLVSHLGLLTILRKNKAKSREMRVLFLWVSLWQTPSHSESKGLKSHSEIWQESVSNQRSRQCREDNYIEEIEQWRHPTSQSNFRFQHQNLDKGWVRLPLFSPNPMNSPIRPSEADSSLKIHFEHLLVCFIFLKAFLINPKMRLTSRLSIPNGQGT